MAEASWEKAAEQFKAQQPSGPVGSSGPAGPSSPPDAIPKNDDWKLWAQPEAGQQNGGPTPAWQRGLEGVANATYRPALNTLQHPLDAIASATGFADWKAAYDAAKQGDYLKAGQHLHRAIDPGFRMGSDIVQPIVEDVKQGNVAGAVGRGIGTGAMLGSAVGGAKVAESTAPVVRGVKGALAGGAQAVGDVPVVGKVLKIPVSMYKGYKEGSAPTGAGYSQTAGTIQDPNFVASGPPAQPAPTISAVNQAELPQSTSAPAGPVRPPLAPTEPTSGISVTNPNAPPPTKAQITAAAQKQNLTVPTRRGGGGVSAPQGVPLRPPITSQSGTVATPPATTQTTAIPSAPANVPATGLGVRSPLRPPMGGLPPSAQLAEPPTPAPAAPTPLPSAPGLNVPPSAPAPPPSALETQLQASIDAAMAKGRPTAAAGPPPQGGLPVSEALSRPPNADLPMPYKVSGQRPLTTGQITQLNRDLHQVASSSGMGHAELSDAMAMKFGVNSMRDMTPDQAKLAFRDLSGEDWYPGWAPTKTSAFTPKAQRGQE